MLAIRRARQLAFTCRKFSTVTEREPNIIQQMPSYLKALEYVVHRKYDKSTEQLEHTIKEVEKVVGPNSIYHLFLYQRLASIHMI